jgi:hypothetical protein
VSSVSFLPIPVYGSDMQLLSSLSSIAETIAGKGTTSATAEPQVDQLLSGIRQCATSVFGSRELLTGKRRERELTGCSRDSHDDKCISLWLTSRRSQNIKIVCHGMVE